MRRRKKGRRRSISGSYCSSFEEDERIYGFTKFCWNRADSSATSAVNHSARLHALMLIDFRNELNHVVLDLT